MLLYQISARTAFAGGTSDLLYGLQLIDVGVFPDSVPETDVGDAPSRWGIEPYLATTLLLEALEHD